MDPEFQSSLGMLATRLKENGDGLSPRAHAQALNEAVESLQKLQQGFEMTVQKRAAVEQEAKTKARLQEIAKELAEMGGKPEFGSLPDDFMGHAMRDRQLRYFDATVQSHEVRTVHLNTTKHNHILKQHTM